MYSAFTNICERMRCSKCGIVKMLPLQIVNLGNFFPLNIPGSAVAKWKCLGTAATEPQSRTPRKVTGRDR